MARMLVVWCPDWPVVAAGAPPDSLTAVVHANRVVACSAAAWAEGVRPGLRRREAQGRCPELELLAHDPTRDARAFEPVLVAVEQLTPWVEVLQPGECAFPARGAARYHGGEPALAVTVTAAVHAAVEGRGGCQVGIADGTFAAGLAARHQVIVPPGGSRAFLAPFPVATLDRPDLADLLVRLGLRTLGDLASLPRADLAARFGFEGARAARLAGGLDEHPKGARRPPPDLRVAAELDPPADRVDVAAFTAKTLADELVARLDRLGLACTRLRIEAGDRPGRDPLPDLALRPHRLPGPRPVQPRPHPPSPPPAGASRPGLADPPGGMAAVMTERVRWQLDGWLTGRTGHLPGALTHLALAPDEVVPDRGRQLGFWGGETEAGQRAARALARIQGLLGPEAVHTARAPRRPRPGGPGLVPGRRHVDPPAPGGPGRARAAPCPGPGRCRPRRRRSCYAEPVPAEVVDATGPPSAVDGRGLLGRPPEPGPGPGPRLVDHQRLGRPLAGRRALVGPGRPPPPGPPPGDHRPGRRLPAPADRRPLVGRGDLRLSPPRGCGQSFAAGFPRT